MDVCFTLKVPSFAIAAWIACGSTGKGAILVRSECFYTSWQGWRVGIKAN